MFIEEIPYTLFEKVDKPLTAPYFWIINTDFIVGNCKKIFIAIRYCFAKSIFLFQISKIAEIFHFYIQFVSDCYAKLI